MRVRFVAFAAFFLSGASSLIFQSIWSRMLSHVFGATGIAISTVVTVFMAGLGLGAWIAGRYADRIRHPIMTYAVAELGVGLWGLLIPFLVDSEGWLSTVNRFLRAEMGAQSFGFALARFACMVPILLVPTTLMGSSLPLLARHFVRAEQRAGAIGSRVGLLYSINTFGAVAGVFLAGFVLMPKIGVMATNVIAVAFNLFLAAAIWVFRKQLLEGTWKPGERLSIWLSKGTVPAVASDDTEANVDAAEKEDDAAGEKSVATEEGHLIQVSPLARKAAYIAFAASGAAALCYEVVWARSLAMVIGSSVYSFSIILVTFLVGIAGGSAVGSGAVAGGARLVPRIGVTALVLTMFANIPWALQNDIVTWFLVTALFSTPIVIAWVAVVLRGRSAGSGLQPSVYGPCAVMLVIPIAAAGLAYAVFRPVQQISIVSYFVSIVTCILALLPLLLISLRRTPAFQLACVQLFIAGGTFVNFLFLDDLSYAFAQLVVSLEDLSSHIGTVQFFMFVTAGLCTLPATMGMGAMFPLTLRLWTSGGAHVGRDVGVLYAGNTVGSIVGSWLPGFILMPLIGIQRTLLVGIWLNLALALLMLIASGDATKSRKKKAEKQEGDEKVAKRSVPIWHAVAVYLLAPLIPALAALLYVGGWLPNGPLRWNLAQMTLGVFRVSLATDVLDPESWGEPDLVYYNDGLSTTVSVEKWGRHLALKNNGKVDASNGDDMPTQIMVAALPLLVHSRGPEGLDVAIIGFGSGVSVGTSLEYPVRSVDVIELERSIPEASKWFEDVNHLRYVLPEFPYIQMDRLRVINDDGRNYLASATKQYDVIVSEPSNPWITGVSDLFTTDHFRITKKRLRPGGIYCQWVQLYELSPENIKTIYRTFASQFRYAAVYSAESLSSDTILLGSDEPLSFDVERMERISNLPKPQQGLARADVHRPYDALARRLFGSRQEIMQYAQIEHRKRGGNWIANPASSNDRAIACANDCRREPVALNTDDNAIIEFGAPRDLIGFQRYEDYLSEIYAPEWPYGRWDGSLEGAGTGEAAGRRYAEMALSLAAHGRDEEAVKYVERSRVVGVVGETLVAAEVISLLLSEAGEPGVTIETPVPPPQMNANEAKQLLEGFEAVRRAVDQRSYTSALAAMEEIPSALRSRAGSSFRFLYGYLLYKGADGISTHYQDGIETLDELATDDPSYAERHPEIWYLLGRLHAAEVTYGAAVRNMRRYVEAIRVVHGAAPAPTHPPTPAGDAHAATDAGNQGGPGL